MEPVNPPDLVIDLQKHIDEGRLWKVRVQLPMDDPMQRKPLITKAKERLDWNPLITLDEGLNKTISYFLKELNL